MKLKDGHSNRRTFLRRGLWGGLILSTFGGGLLAWPTRSTNITTKLKTLNTRTFSVLCAIAARVVPPYAQATSKQIAERVDALLSMTSPETLADINRLLILFDNAFFGLFFHGHFGAFSYLSAETQDRVLESWRDSHLLLRRSGYQALRKLCLAAHYGDPLSWNDIDYSGPRSTGGIFYNDSQWGTKAWRVKQIKESQK